MFKDWITRKYIEWRGDKLGQEASVAAYARWLGITQQHVDGYLKGLYIPKTKKVIDLLVAKYGPEVYDILGMDRSEKDEVIYLIDQVPPEMYPELIRELQKKYHVHIPTTTFPDPPDGPQ